MKSKTFFENLTYLDYFDWKNPGSTKTWFIHIKIDEFSINEVFYNFLLTMFSQNTKIIPTLFLKIKGKKGEKKTQPGCCSHKSNAVLTWLKTITTLSLGRIYFKYSSKVRSFKDKSLETSKSLKMDRF